MEQGDPSEQDREAAAYHEAGHAVISYRLDFGVGTTTIKPGEGYSGGAAGEGVWCDGSRDLDYVTILLAGFAAERRYNPAADPCGSRGDDEEAARLILGLGANEHELRSRADELVAKYWEQIVAVALALVKDETLNGDEVDFICDAVDEDEEWPVLLAEYRARRDSC